MTALQKHQEQLNGNKYNFVHIIYYFFSIKLRKRGYTFKQLEKLVHKYTFEEAEKNLVQDDLKKNEDIDDFENEGNALFTDLSKELINLGRSEGKVLRSQFNR